MRLLWRCSLEDCLNVKKKEKSINIKRPKTSKKRKKKKNLKKERKLNLQESRNIIGKVQ